MKDVFDIIILLTGNNANKVNFKVLLKDINMFLKMLKEFDIDGISVETLNQCNKRLSNPDLTYERIKSVSSAASSIYVWAWNICKIRSLMVGVTPAFNQRAEHLRPV